MSNQLVKDSVIEMMEYIAKKGMKVLRCCAGLLFGSLSLGIGAISALAQVLLCPYIIFRRGLASGGLTAALAFLTPFVSVGLTFLDTVNNGFLKGFTSPWRFFYCMMKLAVGTAIDRNAEALAEQFLNRYTDAAVVGMSSQSPVAPGSASPGSIDAPRVPPYNLAEERERMRSATKMRLRLFKAQLLSVDGFAKDASWLDVLNECLGQNDVTALQQILASDAREIFIADIEQNVLPNDQITLCPIENPITTVLKYKQLPTKPSNLAANAHNKQERPREDVVAVQETTYSRDSFAHLLKSGVQCLPDRKNPCGKYHLLEPNCRRNLLDIAPDDFEIRRGYAGHTMTEIKDKIAQYVQALHRTRAIPHTSVTKAPVISIRRQQEQNSQVSFLSSSSAGVSVGSSGGDLREGSSTGGRSKSKSSLK